MALAGCTTETGSALPAPQSTGESPAASSAVKAPVIKPCELLTAADLATFGGGYGPPMTGKVSVTNGDCRWQRRASELRDDALIGITVWDNLRVDQVREIGGGAPQQGMVNGRKAAQIPGAGGASCITSLATGPSSRIDIDLGVNKPKSLEDTCAQSAAIAKIVEPKLPK